MRGGTLVVRGGRAPLPTLQYCREGNPGTQVPIRRIGA
jgi:hypothetical protein